MPYTEIDLVFDISEITEYNAQQTNFNDMKTIIPKDTFAKYLFIAKKKWNEEQWHEYISKLIKVDEISKIKSTDMDLVSGFPALIFKMEYLPLISASANIFGNIVGCSVLLWIKYSKNKIDDIFFSYLLFFASLIRLIDIICDVSSLNSYEELNFFSKIYACCLNKIREDYWYISNKIVELNDKIVTNFIEKYNNKRQRILGIDDNEEPQYCVREEPQDKVDQDIEDSEWKNVFQDNSSQPVQLQIVYDPSST